MRSTKYCDINLNKCLFNNDTWLYVGLSCTSSLECVICRIPHPRVTEVHNLWTTNTLTSLLAYVRIRKQACRESLGTGIWLYRYGLIRSNNREISIAYLPWVRKSSDTERIIPDNDQCDLKVSNILLSCWQCDEIHDFSQRWTRMNERKNYQNPF